MGRLEGKVALITGAGEGIGRASARRFAKEGAKVAVVDFCEETGKQTTQDIIDEGGEAIFIFCDIRSTGLDDEEFALRLLKDFGVAVVPGSAFGACGAGFVRMSYVTSLGKIRTAVERLRRMLAAK